MNTILLWLIFLIIDLSLILILYRLYGKLGLYTAIIISIIAANIQVIKTVNILGMVVTLGNVLYGSIFLATDLLSELYGKAEAKKGVWLGFYAMIFFLIMMQISLLFTPDPSDFSQPHLKALFTPMFRIVAGSLVAYLISQFHDVWAFLFWKKVTNGKHLWIRNNLSTLTSQLIDSVLFCSIAFLGIWPMNVWFQVLITTYIMKLFVAIIDTPFLYLGRMIGKKYYIKQ